MVEIRIDMLNDREWIHINVRADTAEAILDKLNEAIVYTARELNVNKEQKITKEDLNNG